MNPGAFLRRIERRLRAPLVPVAASAAIALTGAAMLACALAPSQRTGEREARAWLAPPPAQADDPRRTAPRHGRPRPARPVRIEIPAVGIHAAIVPIGLDAGRALQVPESFAVAGWWEGGARPGEPGPAVIAGHVDSRTGPAVFYRLGALRPGDAITIADRRRHRVRFIVHRIERHPKTRFPTAAVYGPTRRPTLRLITCSGAFDRGTGHYLDNTVVYAARG